MPREWVAANDCSPIFRHRCWKHLDATFSAGARSRWTVHHVPQQTGAKVRRSNPDPWGCAGNLFKFCDGSVPVIPEWLIVILAMLGICALVMGKPKWALALSFPALWLYILSPVGWELLRVLPLWVAIPAALIIGARLAIGMFVQALSAIFGRLVAEEASAHVVGHYLQRGVGAGFRYFGWLVALPFRMISRLFD